MVFLIEYDREQGHLVSIKFFADGYGERAEESRLQLELELNLKGVRNEVVLLEAANEEALRRTHRRYFEDLTDAGRQEFLWHYLSLATVPFTDGARVPVSLPD